MPRSTTAGPADEPTTAARRAKWPPLGDLLAVAAGGMIGAWLRVALATLFPTAEGRFPWTTLAENVIGALLLGWLLVLLVERWRPTRRVQPFLCTGVLGSFTTFSAFSLEWVALSTGEQAWLAVVYPVASMLLGLTAAMAGVGLARRWPIAPNRNAEQEADQ